MIHTITKFVTCVIKEDRFYDFNSFQCFDTLMFIAMYNFESYIFISIGVNMNYSASKKSSLILVA